MKTLNPANLELAFDVGHSSLGWAVLQNTPGQSPSVNLLGCGVVTFPADDCLASARRQKRQMRRHVRATRKRIERIAKLLLLLLADLKSDGARKLVERLQAYLNNSAEKRATLQGTGHVAPWLLAARILASDGKREHLLDWPELFDVLRWYAHNRGYDSRPPWISGFNMEEDTQIALSNEGDETMSDEDGTGEENEEAETARKLKEGIARMKAEPETRTMAETVSKILYDDLFPVKDGRTLSQLHAILFDPQQSEMFHKLRRYKGQDAVAFPRRNVFDEVRRILEYHRDTKKLPGCDDVFIKALLEDWTVIPDAWKAKRGDEDKTKLWLPRRFGFEREVRDANNRLIRTDRHYAGLLFGQAIPRFHNRIVSTCPIKYAQVLREQLKAGKPFPDAEHRARLLAKVPAKKSREFLQFRWVANFLANIKVGHAKGKLDRPLNPAERAKINKAMQDKGFLTSAELEKLVKDQSKCEFSNVPDMFDLTPEARDALCIDPVRRYIATDERVQAIWPTARPLHQRIVGQLRRGKRIKLAWVRRWLADPRYQAAKDGPAFRTSPEEFDKALDDYAEALKLAAMRKTKEKGDRRKQRESTPDRKELLQHWIGVSYPSGRAPYHRNILDKAVSEVFAGFDPRKKRQVPTMTEDQQKNAEVKDADGVLVETEDMMRLRLGLQLADVSEDQAFEAWKQEWLKRRDKNGAFRNRELYAEKGDAYARDVWAESLSHRWLANQTNNHLVRHRLLILQRLTQDIIEAQELCDGNPKRIRRVAVEVARDILAFSGMDSVAKGEALKSMSNQHRDVEKYLKKMLEGREYLINGSLLWKAKVADDLKWKCPYTGALITPDALVRGDMDVDHIIPKSVKLTDAMGAVVITFKQINRMKGAFTAWEFVEKCGGQDVPGTGEKIRHLHGQNGYASFVESLKEWGVEAESKSKFWPMYLEDKAKGKLHPDYRRRRMRKKLLQKETTPKEKDGFAARDLTVTSHINRLTQHSLRKVLIHLGPEDFLAIPGVVTAAFRDAKGWQLLGCLGEPEICGDAVMRAVPVLDRETKEPVIDSKTNKPKMKRIAKPKAAIRDCTHLHHAVDACALGLIAHFLPKDGRLWEYVALGELTESEKENYESLRAQFQRGRLSNGVSVKSVNFDDFLCLSKLRPDDKKRFPDPDRIWRLVPRRDEQALAQMNRIKKGIKRELAKKRVVQHIPADRSGFAAKETTWRVFNANDTHPSTQRLARWFKKAGVKIPGAGDSTALLVCRKRRDAAEEGEAKGKTLHDSNKVWRWVYDEVEKSKIAGLGQGNGKLFTLKAGLIIDENFGLALLPSAPKKSPKHAIVRWFNVSRKRERDRLRILNGGTAPELLRKGQLIRLRQGQHSGRIWKVLSVEETGRVRFGAVDIPRRIDKPKENYEKSQVSSLLRDGLEILKPSLIGIAVTPPVQGAC